MLSFSIIIPCYNSEKYIKKTLISLINQTFADFEVILINDGSTDKSIEIAESILRKSKLVYKIVNQSNQGVSIARNNGIQNSRGKYIYMLDSDDTIECSFLEKMYDILEKYQLDMAFCGYNIINENNEIIWKYNDNYRFFKCIKDGKEVLQMVFKSEVNLCTITTVFKRKLLEENNIRYYENCSSGEDHEFWIKGLIHASRVGCLDLNIANYIQRQNSITHNLSLRRFEVLGSVKRIKKYMIKNNLDNKFIKYLDENKYQKEFICNLTDLIKQGIDIALLEDILNNKKFRSTLRRYKIKSLKLFEIRVFIRIWVYTLNERLYAYKIGKYL